MTAPTSVTPDEAYLLGVIDNGEIEFDTATRTFLWLEVPVDPDDNTALAALVADGYVTTVAGSERVVELVLTARGREATR